MTRKLEVLCTLKVWGRGLVSAKSAVTSNLTSRDETVPRTTDEAGFLPTLYLSLRKHLFRQSHPSVWKGSFKMVLAQSEPNMAPKSLNITKIGAGTQPHTLCSSRFEGTPSQAHAYLFFSEEEGEAFQRIHLTGIP